MSYFTIGLTQNIDKLFAAFESSMDQNKIDEIGKIVKALDDTIGNLKLVMICYFKILSLLPNPSPAGGLSMPQIDLLYLFYRYKSIDFMLITY